MEYIFIYGTLLSYFNNSLNLRLKKEGIFIGKGIVMGKLYDSGNYPVAVPDSDNIIYGEIYKIPEILFFDLDDYEDYNQIFQDDSLFVRKRTKVYLVEKKVSLEEFIKNKEKYNKRFCWIYWYNKSIDQFKLIEEGDYIKYLKKQYQL